MALLVAGLDLLADAVVHAVTDTSYSKSRRDHKSDNDSYISASHLTNIFGDLHLVPEKHVSALPSTPYGAIPQVPTKEGLAAASGQLEKLGTAVEIIGLATGQPEIVAGGMALSGVGEGFGALSAIGNGVDKVRNGDYEGGLKDILTELSNLKNIQLSEDQLLNRSNEKLLNKQEAILENVGHLNELQKISNKINNREVRTIEDADGQLKHIVQLEEQQVQLAEENLVSQRANFQDLEDSINPPNDFSTFMAYLDEIEASFQARDFIIENKDLFESFGEIHKRVILVSLSQKL